MIIRINSDVTYNQFMAAMREARKKSKKSGGCYTVTLTDDRDDEPVHIELYMKVTQ